MPAWVEDAQQLTELRDLSSSQSSVLLRTTEVEEFLSNLNLSSHALVAPKGFGKTLVLKLKRVSLQENDYRCFPFSPIVDRPSNKPPILPNEIINVLENSDNWETLWNIAFSICLIKGFQDDRDVHQQLKNCWKSKDLPPTLLNILTHPHITRPFDILHDCLAAQRNEIFRDHARRAAGHAHLRHDPQTGGNIRRQHRRISDSLHQFFLSAPQRGPRTICPHLARRPDRRMARFSRLHGINPHVRIFVSIRKEAYQHAAQNEPQFSNLRSFRRELRYRIEDIKQIIENNIAIASKSDLVDRSSEDPLLRFLGPKNEFVSNAGTARQERAIDYWTRHCSLRPRDAIVIGKEISLIGVKRRSQQEIRNAINSAAAERVETLFNEVAPFFSGLYPEIFPQVIKSNVLTYDEVVEASTRLCGHRRETIRDRNRGCAASFLRPLCVGAGRNCPTEPGRSRPARAEVRPRRRNRLWQDPCLAARRDLSDPSVAQRLHHSAKRRVSQRAEQAQRHRRRARMEARGKHPVCRRWRYSRLPGKRRPDCREVADLRQILARFVPAVHRAIWTTRTRPPATIWFWLIEARAGCCARRAGSAPNSWPPDTICRSEWARIAGSGNSIPLSKARSTPKFPTLSSSLRASSRSPKQGTFSCLSNSSTTRNGTDIASRRKVFRSSTINMSAPNGTRLEPAS